MSKWLSKHLKPFFIQAVLTIWLQSILHNTRTPKLRNFFFHGNTLTSIFIQPKSRDTGNSPDNYTRENVWARNLWTTLEIMRKKSVQDNIFFLPSTENLVMVQFSSLETIVLLAGIRHTCIIPRFSNQNQGKTRLNISHAYEWNFVQGSKNMKRCQKQICSCSCHNQTLAEKTVSWFVWSNSATRMKWHPPGSVFFCDMQQRTNGLRLCLKSTQFFSFHKRIVWKKRHTLETNRLLMKKKSMAAVKQWFDSFLFVCSPESTHLKTEVIFIWQPL